MSIYVIADTHLSLGVDKPMSIFGDHWNAHDGRLKEHWLACVSSTDTVVLPGDISWAMRLSDAYPDLKFLHDLPGRKLLLQGNHDYWWTSIKKMELFCKEQGLDSIGFMRNNAESVHDDLICGTRGWILPDDANFSSADQKILSREAGRLRLSLEDAERVRQPGQRLIACLHFPPLTRTRGSSLLTDLMQEFSVDVCCFGHIHGHDTSLALTGDCIDNISYWLVSADQIGFKPLRL